MYPRENVFDTHDSVLTTKSYIEVSFVFVLN